MLTSVLAPLVVIANMRTEASGKDTAAGYQETAGRSPIVQLPAGTRCPPGPDTHSWQRVPGRTPVTRTARSVPHGRGETRTHARAPDAALNP
jgi:hypothetical protein